MDTDDTRGDPQDMARTMRQAAELLCVVLSLARDGRQPDLALEDELDRTISGLVAFADALGGKVAAAGNGTAGATRH